MIGKNLDAIAEEDLRSLVTLGIAEGITLEFKQQLDLENKEEKREACKDVSALANTAGGRIVYGVVERKSHGPGVAEALHPLSDSGLRDRLGNVLLSGIHPRPRFRSVEVPAAAGGFYLVVEVYPSHAGDLHMVTGYDELRFYKRTDRGTYPMIEPEVREGYVRIAVSRMALDANLEKQVEEELRERSEARESIVVVPWYGSPSLVDPRQIGPLARWLRDGPLRDSDVVQHLVEPHLKVYSRGFRAVSAHGAHYLSVSRSGVLHLSSDRLVGDDQTAYGALSLVHRLLCTLELARHVLESASYFGPVRLHHVFRVPGPFQLRAYPFFTVGDPEWGEISGGTYQQTLHCVDFREAGKSFAPAVQVILDQVFNIVGLAECPWFGPDGQPTGSLKGLLKNDQGIVPRLLALG